MSLACVSITLNIRNNKTYPIRINVLGSPYNPLDTTNAKTEYRWDITSFTPSNDDLLTLEYKQYGAAVFSTYTSQIYNTNIDGIIAALDGLGIGYFQSYTELGQLYLSTYNDVVEFGLLTISNNGAPATSTTTTTTTAAPTTSTTTSTTTAAPTTSTTSTTTAAPTTSTTSTTTAAPTTSTTSTTTAAPTTSTTSTTTTAAVFTYALGVDSISGNGACLDFTIAPINYYSASSSLVNGVVLYQDPALSTLVPDNYYSDGIQNWLITSGNGTLTTETLCSLTTTTTSTTTAAPTSTTTTSTTAAPTSTTTTSTTTAAPTTSTTTTSTTVAPTTMSIAYAANGANVRLEASALATLTETIEFQVIKTESHTYDSTNCGTGETIPNNLFPTQIAVIASGTTFGSSVDITAIGTLQSTKIDACTIVWSDTTTIFVSSNNTIVTSPVTGLSYLVTNILVCTPL